MAEVGKKSITVDTAINMYGETRTKKAPEWFGACPALQKLPDEVQIKRTMSLDPRKWSKKTIEEGAYAVARYDLAFFATALGSYEGKITKALPKDQKKAKFNKDMKDISDDVKKELTKAENEVVKLHKKFSKAIRDKVSLAFDEIEADKGDNKKALAAGKEALKKFDELDTSKMFAGTTAGVEKALSTLARDLASGGEKGAPAAYKKAKTAIAACQKEFDAKARTAHNVAKYLLYKGDKMAKDKDAAPALQDIGKALSANGPLKSALNKMSSAVDEYGKSLDDIASMVNGEKATAAEAKTAAKQFETDHKGKDGAVKDAAKEMKDVSQKFNKAAQQVKA